MRNGIFLAIAAFGFLTGCENMGNQPYNNTAASKWKPPYHLEFAAQPAKPNPAGVAVPVINFKAVTKETERRAALVVRFDASAVKNDQPAKDRLIMTAVDISSGGGKLPDDYMDSIDKQLGKMLAERCMKGTVKISVAFVRSSIRPAADDTEINAKLLSDWVPGEVTFKNPHPKCEIPQPAPSKKG